MDSKLMTLLALSTIVASFITVYFFLKGVVK